MYRLDCAIWELTLACNMRCIHCGSSAGEARSDELSLEDCYKLCRGLADEGCNLVTLMGGEPFVRPDWNQISWCIKDLGMDLGYVTNGLLVPNIIEDLTLLEPLVVGISLDGVKETHDSIRREGSYDSVIKVLDLLEEASIQTTVITTLSKTNFKELHSIKEIIQDRKVNWQLQIGLPFGNFDPELTLSLEEFYASAMFITAEGFKNKFDHMPVVGAHCYGYYSHLLPNNKNWKGCTAGINTIGITSDGSIVGCLSMGNDKFIEGNIRDRNFSDIWNGPNSFAYNRRFTRANLGENCVNCIFGETCKGGCNSTSYHLNQTFHNTAYCFKQIEENLFEAKQYRKEIKWLKQKGVKT